MRRSRWKPRTRDNWLRKKAAQNKTELKKDMNGVISACVCTEKKNQTKDNVEKEGKKKLYVLERKVVCRNEEETEQILPV